MLCNVGCRTQGHGLLHAEEGPARPPIYVHRLTVFVDVSHSLLSTLRSGLRVVMAHVHGWMLMGTVVQASICLDVILLGQTNAVKRILSSGCLHSHASGKLAGMLLGDILCLLTLE